VDLTGFRIPPAHREAVAALRDMSDEQFDALKTGLAEASPFAGSSGLTAQVTGQNDLESSTVRSIVLVLLSLYTQLKFHGWTKEDLATGVSLSEDLPPSDGKSDASDKLAKRLEDLLDLESVVTTARALDLVTENEHLFHSARVLTDIRPVFGEDPKQPPSGALVAETLKVEYFDEGTIHSLFLSLSRGELQNLRDTVDRALMKSDTVHDLLEQIGLSHFDAEQED
jgi:hypothetical protein